VLLTLHGLQLVHVAEQNGMDLLHLAIFVDIQGQRVEKLGTRHWGTALVPRITLPTARNDEMI